MMTCEQTHGQTILEHGEAVASTFKAMFGPEPTGCWIYPEIIRQNLTWLLSLCPSADVLETYHVFHDCGKPDCLHIDADGKRHFPAHALRSASVWLAAGGDQLIGRLIEHDMDFHTMKQSDLVLYKHLDIAPALLLTAWAELNANARMFGGYDSVSFKIKAKSLTKLSKAFIKLLKEQS